MKNTTKEVNLNPIAPVYTSDYSNYSACLCIDKENNECWADIRPDNSYSQAEWDGRIDRIRISKYFLSLDELNDFIDEVIEVGLAEEYATARNDFEKEIVGEEIASMSSHKTGENIICENFSDYIQSTSFGRKEVLEEILESGSINNYAEDLMSNTGSVYFVNVDEDKLVNDIIEFIK